MFVLFHSMYIFKTYVYLMYTLACRGQKTVSDCLPLELWVVTGDTIERHGLVPFVCNEY